MPKQRRADAPGPGWAAALRRAGCLAVLAIAGAQTGAHAQSSAVDEIVVTPYRPTVSTPAALSAPGWLELETGWQRADLGAASPRDSIPYTLKLAISDDWGIRIGGESWVRGVDAQGQRAAGGGDTALILKRRFGVDARSAFGLEFGVAAPTARAGLHSGSGGTDYTATGIYSADLGPAWHTDLNLGITQLGVTEPAENRRQTMWAAALSDAVSGHWGIVGEWSGTRRAGTSATGQILLAATYAAAKRLVVDVGVARGTTAVTPAWTVFAGCTVLVARLF